MFKEHSRVVLKRPLPALGLKAGDVGVVIHVHNNGAAYEVEFISMDGRTIGVETLKALDVRVAKANAIAHERDRQTV